MPEQTPFQRVVLRGEAGSVDARLSANEGDLAGVVLVGGVGGGFDSPARDLYGRLQRLFPVEGVSVVRVRFRLPGDLDEAALDVRAAVALLQARGVERVGLVGHSFGGAVVIRAAASAPAVATVVTLSTQSYGTEAVDRLDRPVLLIHGTDDEVLPPGASIQVYRRAPDGSELHLLEGARHLLDENAEEVRALVQGWLRDRLLPMRAGASP
jgi:pimeloyl-ACP methyl ester carboxylesterase